MFKRVYQQTVCMAAAVNEQPSKPRNCATQRNWPNATADTVEEWYRVNVVIPFLDHIVEEINELFSPVAQTSSMLLGLVPSVMFHKDIDISCAVEMYSGDLPSSEQFDQEFSRWKSLYSQKDSSNRPTTLASTLKECDRQLFPNIYVLLQIVCTLERH